MQLTNNGLSLLAKVIAERRTLTFSKVLLGDSIRNNQVVTPTAEQILDMTSPIHAINFNVPITSCKKSGSGTAVVTCNISNENLTTGFFAREVALYAKTDDNDETLFSYSNAGNLGSYIAAGGGSEVVNLNLNLVVVIDQVQSVKAVISGDVIFATQADLSSHVNSATPHPNIPKLSTEITGSPSFWATGSDNQLHPITSSNLSLQILGDNLYELPHLNNRIAQTEINVANLFMQLNAEKELGLEANLLLFEDFVECDTVDLFSVKVNDEVAGTDNVCVESIDGIVEGARYTISDGVRYQAVAVKSVAKNENLYVVMFDAPLRYTFNLKKTKLYRSTGLVYDNKLDGAGDLRSSTYRFSDVWTGATASASQTLALTTTNANAKNFTLSGDYAFSSSGEFTLN